MKEGYRLLTDEEKIELLKCKHENMKVIDGFDHNIGIGTIHYDSYECPDCGFYIPFDTTGPMDKIKKSWEEYLMKSTIYVPIKKEDKKEEK